MNGSTSLYFVVVQVLISECNSNCFKLHVGYNLQIETFWGYAPLILQPQDIIKTLEKSWIYPWSVCD